jgi:hypothetical protein
MITELQNQYMPKTKIIKLNIYIIGNPLLRRVFLFNNYLQNINPICQLLRNARTLFSYVELRLIHQ